MSKPRLKLHVRILAEEQIAFGPGKAELLEAIQRTLVDTMNQCFHSHLVETQTGGTHGGGAVVTEFGQMILKKFRAMEQHALQTLESEFQDISRYLKP